VTFTFITLKSPTAVTPSWQPMQSSEFPYSVVAAPFKMKPPLAGPTKVEDVPFPLVKAWFQRGP
jgi:hypothetical protein